MVTGLKGFVPRVEVAQSHTIETGQLLGAECTWGCMQPLRIFLSWQSLGTLAGKKTEVPNMLVVSYYQIDTPQGTKVCILGDRPGNSARRC